VRAGLCQLSVCLDNPVGFDEVDRTVVLLPTASEKPGKPVHLPANPGDPGQFVGKVLEPIVDENREPVVRGVVRVFIDSVP